MILLVYHPNITLGLATWPQLLVVHQFLIRFLLLHISGVPLTRITLGMLYTLCFSYRNRFQLHASSQWEYSHPLPFGLTSPAREWWNAIPLSTWLSSQKTQLHKLSHPSKPSYVGFLKLLSWFLNYSPTSTFKNSYGSVLGNLLSIYGMGVLKVALGNVGLNTTTPSPLPNSNIWNMQFYQ